MIALDQAWARAFRAVKLRSAIERALEDQVVTVSEVRRWLRPKPRRRR